MRFFQKIGYWTDRVKAFSYRCFGRNHLCDCGHRSKWKTVLEIDGIKGVFKLPKNKEYCGKCFAEAAIKCAWCGGTILPGDPITLYTPKKDFEIPNHAVIYKRVPLQLVGCLGWDCCQTGGDRAGFWVMPGKVYRVMSPIGMLLAHGNEGAVIIGDLGDISKAIPIKEDTDSE